MEIHVHGKGRVVREQSQRIIEPPDDGFDALATQGFQYFTHEFEELTLAVDTLWVIAIDPLGFAERQRILAIDQVVRRPQLFLDGDTIDPRVFLVHHSLQRL